MTPNCVDFNSSLIVIFVLHVNTVEIACFSHACEQVQCEYSGADFRKCHITCGSHLSDEGSRSEYTADSEGGYV